MCGICGFISLIDKDCIEKETLSEMNNTMQHRGPDDEGMYLDLPISENKYRVGLGHRRLSIIDLSIQGHQPMSNEDGSVWIVYNGEIYNFKELKDSLIKKGHQFKSNTDTEVIIHLYEEKGKDCVKYLRGMFAFGIWDKKNKTLFAARDRLGKKPFYYYAGQNKFIFASEAKALLKSNVVPGEVNRQMLDVYLALGYVPAPYTMFKNIFKLLPGHTLMYKDEAMLIEKYWDVDNIEQDYSKNEQEYLREFKTLLYESVNMRLISDVPLGVFLSGGIDSSTVVAFMSQIMKDPVKTFTIGYKDKESSELEYARIIAKKFKTEHHEFCLEPADFYTFIPNLVWYFDEPVVEAAAIPLYFISKLAKQHVTVLLSGEGADELFAGYSVYNHMKRIEFLRKFSLFQSGGLFNKVIGSYLGSEKKKNKFSEWLSLPLEQRYLGVSFENQENSKNTLYSQEFRCEIKNNDKAYKYLSPYYKSVQNKDLLTKMLYVDTKVWLPDDLLIKADKMSMATSVELRVPFLDQKLVEFAMRLPSNFKLRNRTTKYLLKKAVADILPKEIIYRKKRGFPVPIDKWFKGDFSEKSSDLLLDNKSIKRGYFDTKQVSEIIKQHKDGKENHSKLLFSLMVLEVWHRVFIDNEKWTIN